MKTEEKINKGTTQVVLNNLEMSYAEDIHSTDSFEETSEYIFFVEDFRRKKRARLDKTQVPEIQKEIEFWIKKHPSIQIIHIFQFKKGTKKTSNYLQIAIECQLVKETKGICLYEPDPSGSYLELSNQLDIQITLAGTNEKYMVLEIESNELIEKIQIVLTKGIKNFIFIGGNYQNNDLWINKVINKIHKEGGKVGILFPARMHITTKESYFKKGIQFGADFIFHGKKGGGKVKQILYLDEKDLVYKPLEDLNDEELNIKVKNLTKDEKYKLSRILAINNGNRFAKTFLFNKVVQTR